MNMIFGISLAYDTKIDNTWAWSGPPCTPSETSGSDIILFKGLTMYICLSSRRHMPCETTMSTQVQPDHIYKHNRTFFFYYFCGPSVTRTYKDRGLQPMAPKSWMLTNRPRRTPIFYFANSRLLNTFTITLSHHLWDHWSEIIKTCLGCSPGDLVVSASILFRSVDKYGSGQPSWIFFCYHNSSITIGEISSKLHIWISLNPDMCLPQSDSSPNDQHWRKAAIFEFVTSPLLDTAI